MSSSRWPGVSERLSNSTFHGHQLTHLSWSSCLGSCQFVVSREHAHVKHQAARTS
jgi:hypothetical protein